MATSTKTYSPEIVGSLEVVDSFNLLMKAATSKDSLYIRAKESLTAYFSESTCTLSEREKANMLVELISGMSIQMTNSSMSTALAIAKENRDGAAALTKLREETLLLTEQRDKVATDSLKVTADTSKINADTNNAIIQGWKLQSDMVRENGVNAFPSITSTLLPVSNVDQRGLKWEQEQQTKMSVYATLAKSYRESGVVSWSVDANNKINSISDISPSTPGLTRAQEKVAIRQEIGFDDNKRQHAANSSANMIGLLLSAEESGAITAADVAQWRTAVGYLNTGAGAYTPLSGIIDVVTLEEGDTVYQDVVTTITGTSENFTAGTAITCKITTGTGITLKTSDLRGSIIQPDGTWSLSLAVTDIDNLVPGAANITIFAVDVNGIVIEDNSLSTINIVAVTP